MTSVTVSLGPEEDRIINGLGGARCNTGDYREKSLCMET
jgi:hypothetical protein